MPVLYENTREPRMMAVGRMEEGAAPLVLTLLFDFKGLPKPTFVPSQAEGGSAPMETDPPAAAVASSGKKRKAAENGA